MLTRRPAIEYIKASLKGDLVGVEIGVWRGENAVSILQHKGVKKLYLVDPYVYYEGFERIPSIGNLPDDWKIANDALAKFKDRIKFLKLKASDAADLIPNELDFIYIDGNHAYEYVKQDIENYWKKLKKGGVMGGHDFNAMDPGVNQAVNEFVIKENICLYAVPHDWWVIK